MTEHPRLHVTRWSPDGEVRAIVLLAHGMVEHAGRYAHLASRLTAARYAVYAPDHRGHGRSVAGPDGLGHLADESGFARVVDDLVAFAEVARAEHPGAPLVVLGHSMGSFVARALAARYPDLPAALIVSGTAGDPGLLGTVGLAVAEAELRLRGPRARSRLLEALILGTNNLAFRPNRTRYDWLSRDEAQVDAYAADELCGGTATTAFYRDLLLGLRWVSRPETAARMRPDLPVLILSGEVDPVGGAAAVEEVAALFEGAGVQDVTTSVWPGGRHEMFNEINRDEVVDDVLAWLDVLPALSR